MLGRALGRRGDAKMRRFELEFLPPSRRFVAHVASEHELPALVDLTIRHLPDITPAADAILNVHRKSKSILAISAKGQLVGGIAVLALNLRGKEALLADRLSVVDPDLAFLCHEHERTSAIYAWALCVPGMVVGAMGQIMDWLRQPRFIGCDIYACPGSVGGGLFMRKTGFHQLGQMFGGGPLSVYRRPIA